MKYPTIYRLRTQQQIQGLEEQIEKLKKQNRMLRAGAIEAVIMQNNQEIRQIQAIIDKFTAGKEDKG